MQKSTTVDDLVTYMSLSIQEKNPWGKFHIEPLKYFSPAFAFVLDDNDISGKLRNEDLDSYGVFIDTQLSDLEDPNIDISILQRASKEEQLQGTKYQIVRSRLLQPIQTRQYHFSGRPTLHQTTAFVKENGSFVTGKRFLVKTGRQWRVAVNTDRPNDRYGEDVTIHVQAICGIVFSQYFEWTVILGYPGYPHVTFNCTPRGAREVFKLRDVPEGKQRRSAIHHWVGEHRRRKTESDEYINILDYLRGQTEFKWNGLNCTIKPSPSDLKKYYNLHPEKQALLYR